MKRILFRCCLLMLVASAVTLVPPASFGQAKKKTGTKSTTEAEAVEPLTQWQWYMEIRLPEENSDADYFSFVVPPAVFDQSRKDLHDLRITGNKGRRIPYALRVHRPEDRKEAVPFQRFNEGSAGGVTTVRLEMKGDEKLEHNAIKIDTADSNFHRRVEVQGKEKPDGKWASILPDEKNAFVVYYKVGNKEFKYRTIHYPVSRLPYLRVRVHADPSKKGEDAPRIDNITVYRTVKGPGQYVTHKANVGERQPERENVGPASVWIIDLGGRVPVSRLILDIKEDAFSRPFRLEQMERDFVHAIIARGELQRSPGQARKPPVIDFEEVFARKLRLIVADAANPPLTLTDVQYRAAMREVIFARPKGITLPLRLYYGNPQAMAPHYDFANTLPRSPQPATAKTELGEATKNPDYQPPPQAWSKRFPWLIYVVLGMASLGVLAMFLVLARESLRRETASQAATKME